MKRINKKFYLPGIVSGKRRLLQYQRFNNRQHRRAFVGCP